MIFRSSGVSVEPASTRHRQPRQSRWFAEELVPLYERKQRMLQESLARKTLGLVGAVRSALEMGFSYARIEGEDRLQFEEVDLALRRSAGDLQKFQSELRRTTEEITLLAPFIVNRAAASIADIWHTENQEVDCVGGSCG